MLKVLKWFFYYLILELIILFLISYIYISSGNEISMFGEFVNNNRNYIVLLIGIIFIPIIYIKYKKINIKENKTKNINILIFSGISLSLLYNVIGFYLDKILNTNLYGVFDIKNTIISTVLIGPVIEEYLFRGIIYNEAKNKYNKAGLITTIIFAFSHTNFIQIIYAFILGYVLIKIYDKYNNIKYCILVHMFSNLVTTFITLILIKNNILINFLIFLIGFGILIFINKRKYDII